MIKMVMLNAVSERSVMFMVHIDAHTHAHSAKDSNALSRPPVSFDTYRCQ